VRPPKVVLYVDGDEYRMSRRVFVLETWGYRVLTATTAAAALARLVDASLSLDLLFLQAPVPDRDELIRCAKDMQPEMRTLIAGDRSGYEETSGADVYLPRSCTAAEIRERIKVLVARKRGPKKLPASVAAVERREVA
jgi:two-component system response regulator CpxR